MGDGPLKASVPMTAKLVFVVPYLEQMLTLASAQSTGFAFPGKQFGWPGIRSDIGSLIKSLVMEYENPWWIPFRVSCVVVDQEGVNRSARLTLWAMISADLGSAMAAADGQFSGLGPLQIALASSNALTAGTFDRAQAASTANAALIPVRRQIAQDSELLVFAGANINSTSDYSSAFAARVACAGSLSAAVNVAAYIGRIGSTLGQVG
jgi:hypothetical protein